MRLRQKKNVLHATVLREDLSKALELISDLVFHSVFPKEGVTKEREVILRNTFLQRRSHGFDLRRFRRKIFGDTHGHAILGYPGP